MSEDISVIELGPDTSLFSGLESNFVSDQCINFIFIHLSKIFHSFTLFPPYPNLG
jgi:hypothetical protein